MNIRINRPLKFVGLYFKELSSLLMYFEEIIGLCLDMCPEKEREFREKEKLLHPFEVLMNTKDDQIPKADPDKIVKCYTRSAAGKDLMNSESLRPPRILLSTIHYLFNNVFMNEEYEWNYVYDFINDRLKAVRQDMVVQNLPKASSVAIMQPVVRFYAYSAYRLCEFPLKSFDSKLNESELIECLKKLLSWYDDFDVLEEILEGCGYDFYNLMYVQARPEIEATYLILNLGNACALNRALQLPQKWKSKLVQEAINLSLCTIKGNWVRACRYIKLLPVFLKSLAILKLPEIRRGALKVMSVAYYCKNSTYPLCKLEDLLFYSAIMDVKSDCKYYNIAYDDNDYIQFQSKSFNSTKNVNKPFKDENVNRLLEYENWNIPFMLLNGFPGNETLN